MIYFMQRPGGGTIKIGCTEDVEARCRQLEYHCCCPFEILATIPGDYETESEIHRKFAHLRYGRTEQFRPGSDLLSFLGQPIPADHNPEGVEPMVGSKWVIRGTKEYGEWIDGLAEILSKKHGVPIQRTQMFEIAMTTFARAHGLPEPPARY